MKYKVTYWLNADFTAEEIINEENINFKTNDLWQYNQPTKNAKYKVLDTIKINRTSYEKYDEKPNIINKDRTSDKWY